MAAMRRKYGKKGPAHFPEPGSDPGSGRRRGSRPVSRVLSWAIIHLGPPSPAASCDLPESTAGHGIAFLFGLAPGGVYLATACYHVCGALLPHHFTLTGPGFSTRTGGIFSVALSVDSRPPGVTWHPALWSPDFPPHRMMERLPGRLPGLLSHKAPGKKPMFLHPVPSRHRVLGGKHRRSGRLRVRTGSWKGTPVMHFPAPVL